MRRGDSAPDHSYSPAARIGRPPGVGHPYRALRRVWDAPPEEFGQLYLEGVESDINVKTGENPKSFRGRTYTDAHISEIAFWTKVMYPLAVLASSTRPGGRGTGSAPKLTTHRRPGSRSKSSRSARRQRPGRVGVVIAE